MKQSKQRYKKTPQNELNETISAGEGGQDHNKEIQEETLSKANTKIQELKKQHTDLKDSQAQAKQNNKKDKSLTHAQIKSGKVAKKQEAKQVSKNPQENNKTKNTTSNPEQKQKRHSPTKNKQGKRKSKKIYKLDDLFKV